MKPIYFCIVLVNIIVGCDQSKRNNSSKSNTEKRILKAEYLKQADLPMQGTYNYMAVSAEWNGLEMFEVQVIIKSQNRIKILRMKNQKSMKDVEVIAEGVIMKHKSGKWIIGNKPEDAFTNEFGGCSGGPPVIDFKEKKFWMC